MANPGERVRLTPEESDAVRAIDSAAIEVMALYGGNLDHPALDHLEAAVGAIHALSAERASARAPEALSERGAGPSAALSEGHGEQCGAGGCTNPPPPPDKWAKCFYDGSPCYRWSELRSPSPFIGTGDAGSSREISDDEAAAEEATWD